MEDAIETLPASIAHIDATRPRSTSPVGGKTPLLAELKNGKVTFKQKPIALDKLSETMQEIVAFRAMVEQLQEPINQIPSAHYPLIAKLAHESDKLSLSLAKQMKSHLLPATVDSESQGEQTPSQDLLPLGVIEVAIRAVADRVNWGIENSIAAVSIWRWEVKDFTWLPKQVQEKAEHRKAEREAAKSLIAEQFSKLDAEQQLVLLKGALKKEKEKAKFEDQDEQPSASTSTARSRQKKAADPERVAKDKEKQEKKADKVEKDKKKQEATSKSANAFASFFNKPAKPKASPRPSEAQVSDYTSAFRPFIPKKTSDVAPINYFIHRKTVQTEPPLFSKRDPDVIIIDEDIVSHGTGTKEDVIILDDDGDTVFRDACHDVRPRQPTIQAVNRDWSTANNLELLESFMSSLDLNDRTHRVRRPGFKVACPSVRELMSKLSEAETSGDQRTFRRLDTILQDTTKYHNRLFVFAEDARPGYLGTWSKSSSVIGPRTPFAKEAESVIDYNNDSGDEWEEEDAEGENLESADEEEADEASTADSEDDWMVGDDVIEMASETDAKSRSGSPVFDQPPTAKRKVDDKAAQPSNKKRKVVQPLMPFVKGPAWETVIGECQYPPFSAYRIQLLNDTPFPINPFTFISQDSARAHAHGAASVKATADGFVIPALPSHLQTNHSATNGPDPSQASSLLGTPTATSKARPSIPMPDIYLPDLLTKVHGSSLTLPVLIDSVYQELKVNKVKKYQVEGAIKALAEKDKATKRWYIRGDEPWIKAGIPRPN